MSEDLESGASLFFAHETPRESQISMISDGLYSLLNGGFLLAAAPTGIGKTAASIASALRAAFLYNAGEERLKIMFLTGRQSQHRIVVDTIKEVNKKIPPGFSRVRLVDIIGREGMCENIDRSTGKCNCEEGLTESEKRFLRSGLEEFIHSEPRHVDQVLRRVKNEDICAWSTAREAAKTTDIVVCDYNHVFVEGVREASLPVMGVDLENTILIIDEAHNLPDRIRSGLERRITERVLQRALAEAEEYKEDLQKKEAELEIPESNQLKEAKILELQIRALRDGNGLRNWFEEKHNENNGTKGDDLKVDTQNFLDVISDGLEGVFDENSDDQMKSLWSRFMDLMT